MESYAQHPTMFRSNPLGFIGCVIVFPVGVFILLWWYLSARNTLFTIDNTEIRFETGVLSKEHSEISRANVRSLKVRQSLLDRVMGVGTVEVYTAGDRPEIIVKGLPDPHQVREIIN